MVVSVLLKVKFWARPNYYAQNKYSHVKKQPSSTSLTNYPKGEPVAWFGKMHVYIYKISSCGKGKMKESKNF